MHRSILWTITGIFAVGLISTFVGQGTKTTVSADVEKNDEPSADAIEAAKRAIKAEPKVKDFIYQPGQAVEWQIGVLDDGTSRVGYANYICDLLAEHRASKPKTHVRIVDIAKVANGQNFRAASLGHVACADREVFNP